MAMSGLPTPISDPQSLTPKPAPWDDPQVAAGGAAGADEERVCQFLIDTTPELRVQAIARRMNYVDGVFFTHAHADHVTGLDDLRRFNAVMDKAIPIYADRATLDRLAQMFTYIFEPGRNVNPTFIPNLIPHALEAGQEVELEGAKWTALSLRHGRLPVLGFRVDFAGQAVAYCTDVSSIPPETYPLLENLDVLVIDALRYRHHPTHLTVEQALHEVDQIKPKRAYFTHIAHDICHAELQEKLPAGVFLGYDGLNVIC
ncbi:MAG: MBL fold metallo-hydrolase [Phycisphaeraceae bacterium]|nr:MBL fold metallo-hydrolase [Phycisphaeraceae bacterium]